MKRRALFAAVVAVISLAGTAVRGGDTVVTDDGTAVATRKPGLAKRAWISICRDFKRNNAWPDPFVPVDRVAARQPFDICTANGWRLQNTLSDYHFAEGTNELTATGHLKVAAIINESPLPYRAIFVLRGEDPGVTSARVASAQESVARVLGDRPPVPIFETYDKPRGTPAFYVDEVTRRYQATIPDPRLPEGDDTESSSATGTSTK